jgi:hypothetical protein
LSDHCPIHLCIDVKNWGPKPVRLLKCWENFSGYDSFVREKWSSFQLEGWGGYVLKEKFKLIKLALKDWHKRHATNLPARISSLKDRISDFELKGESWICWMRRLKRCMGVRRSCFRYLGLILVFVGNSQGFSG